MTRTEALARTRKTYITQGEAADILGVHECTVRRMAADGRLKAYRVGPRMIRLRLDEVEAALRPVRGNA
ncbi:DNA binding domain-containing protein [Mycobacteroides abscessus subsp. abscessus]|uniref:excisionase family DNA-binding protein n=1 Tax=Mycobacteroides abscessus TaxID=36809 RepID=UPI000926429C|nr:excisionase family DNA-binding protein [Mycobacteroides abscessus]SHT00453.1 DNA binding domain-containing protein [Mycobacteroides abscessus subsp. abscessus]SHT24559.1 DNA binding domain-containing protein [Mycobacteroides abscessus subsp. abscessus]SHT62145.1 DNA binding domain-containing protein [Mycobacteroides abscessus subsp. abscessus]SHX77888.1 DNA binding domain-containing protein [Mycobacteroides abscessus subsp. abscessus]SIB42582.1 DNA binding domain-containing protein [Mycobac